VKDSSEDLRHPKKKLSTQRRNISCAKSCGTEKVLVGTLLLPGIQSQTIATQKNASALGMVSNYPAEYYIIVLKKTTSNSLRGLSGCE